MTTLYEVEQKFRVSDLDSFAAKLTELGAQWHPPSEQEDEYFNSPHHDFAQSDEALRIRRVNDAYRITYKGPKISSETKTRQEIEIGLASESDAAVKMGAMFKALKFEPVAVVRKRRRQGFLQWQGYDFELALDEVENLGTFLEVEISATENDLSAAQACVLQLTEHLGLTESERRSYLELLMESD